MSYIPVEYIYSFEVKSATEKNIFFSPGIDIRKCTRDRQGARVVFCSQVVSKIFCTCARNDLDDTLKHKKYVCKMKSSMKKQFL